MPKCPECGGEIDYVKNIQNEWTEYEFRIGDDGCGEYEATDGWSGDFSEFKCPLCNKQFLSEEEAEAFLKGDTLCSECMEKLTEENMWSEYTCKDCAKKLELITPLE